MTAAPYRIGVDIGGTFTDFVLLDTRDGTLRNGKVLTTPAAPEEAVLAGIRQLLTAHGIAPADVQHVIHGTTLVANALIERRGVPTGLITTDGFRDIVEIGTELRHDTYDLFMRVPEPLVPRRRRVEVPERVLPDGTVRTALDEAAARAAARDLVAQGAQAVAVCFLHAFRNPAHERRMAEIIAEEAPGLTLCLSSDVVPEIGEYERASTTICNAYVLPVFRRYLTRLAEGLRGLGLTGPLYLMLSDGGTVGEATAARHPIRLVQSGPAGGVRATALYGVAAGAPDILCFDMGGTTAKACLIEGGEPLRSLDFEVARVDRFRKGSGLPLKVPVIEMIEIGAGGGSIAQVDRLGLIRVGPESASSDPGPACYGLGGTRPTVTDADLVLGYLGADSFLGGDMRLDVAAAERALREHLAEPLGLSVVEAAWALHETVNGNMAQAAAIHALEKARRIEGYTMVPIGGAGPVHAAQVCRKLGIAKLVAPAGAGVASAFGFLASPISFAFVRGWVAPLDSIDFGVLRDMVGGIEAEGRAMLAEAGVAPGAAIRTVIGALRYVGQGFQVEAEIPGDALAAGDRDAVRAAFERRYLQQYGRTEPSLPVECVSWQVIMAGPVPEVSLCGPSAGAGAAAAPRHRLAWFPETGGHVETPVIDRASLRPGDRVAGPALVEERESTLVLPPGTEAICDASLNLLVSL
ncbi:hydantoinase/oxoprolinase family protein [Roseomonas sp. CECT 9278]|uniref:hydantoinase/oxoprolinase family protein n=1 Tax=Roseomonas sp. CECT 9278 TaxID=2845823 RepID=UPI001E5ACEC1|nr:hydantoinase/oxoprolinase family protein [Roseomonas sp. CECT 9278]CAH0244046.1 Acetophenone carboxylase gamma subunit [Roseomonas sp. CECT 9278]